MAAQVVALKVVVADVGREGAGVVASRAVEVVEVVVLKALGVGVGADVDRVA